MLLGSMLVLLLFGGAGPASAHAAVRSTDPADGSVLKSAPRQVTLTFTESVGLLDDSFRVYDPSNHRVSTGEAQHVPGRSDTARITLPARLGTGTFTVAWRVVSADSHPVSGAFTFSIGKPSATTAPLDTGETEDPATGSLWNIGRYVAYMAAALLIGTLTFDAVCRPPDLAPLRKAVAGGWWTLVAATVVLFVLRAPYEEGASPATAFDVSALTRTATGRPGLLLLTRLALLLVTGALLLLLRRRTTPPGRPLLAAGAVLAVGLALTWAAAEHASAGIQVPVAITSSVLHLLAMAVWLGGLTALLTTLRGAAGSGSVTVPPATVTRFSRLAFASVIVLAVTGVYQSWRGLGSLRALGDTTYGRLLVVKLAAVMVLLLMANFSRQWTARLAVVEVSESVRERVPETVGGPSAPPQGEAQESGRESTRESTEEPDQESSQKSPQVSPPSPLGVHRALRRSALAEVAVAVVVLGVTTVLTGTLPARAEAEAAADGSASASGLPTASVTLIPFDLGKPGARGNVQVTLDSGRVGRRSVEAVVYGPDGGLSTVPELRLSFTLPAQKIGPIDAKVTNRGGYWGTDSLNLPIPGTWTMKATVRVSEVDQVSASRTVRITR
ncbi:copper resistance CopC/CopD family protein [Streptomyces sp. NPDC001843]|uniref:copper resistance CopC/CopD family protein n=1 Tax=Streptomyces sp. NPDC001843 TaxID=3364617 RepID=UPI003687D398